MCSNTSSYLHSPFPIKTLLLALSTAFFLTACGIKGPLYQTPPQPETVNDTVDEQQGEALHKSDNEQKNTEKSWNELEGLVAPSDMPKSLEAEPSNKEEPVIESESNPSTVQELEPQ